jgi:hypothetical protein
MWRISSRASVQVHHVVWRSPSTFTNKPTTRARSVLTECMLTHDHVYTSSLHTLLFTPTSASTPCAHVHLRLHSCACPLLNLRSPCCPRSRSRSRLGLRLRLRSHPRRHPHPPAHQPPCQHLVNHPLTLMPVPTLTPTPTPASTSMPMPAFTPALALSSMCTPAPTLLSTLSLVHTLACIPAVSLTKAQALFLSRLHLAFTPRTHNLTSVSQPLLSPLPLGLCFHPKIFGTNFPLIQLSSFEPVSLPLISHPPPKLLSLAGLCCSSLASVLAIFHIFDSLLITLNYIILVYTISDCV